MKLRIIACLCAVCILFSGCTRIIRGPRDEIRLYTWESELENGNMISLSFFNGNANLNVKNKDFELRLSGLCSLTDDSFVIINDDDGIGYTFEYLLTGDHVALSYRGDTVNLEKKVEK